MPDNNKTINEFCPWSGKPVQNDSITVYKGKKVGFCNTGCKDKFEIAVHYFEDILKTNIETKR